MSHRTHLVWADDFTAYNFGPTHPMGPLRLDLTTRLIEAFGLLDAFTVIAPDVASDELLATVHEPEYIEAVKQASADPASADLGRGLGTEDDPAFGGMHEASARIVQGTVEICEAVWRGEADHAVNFCGGLHHAMATHASGFCIYNDITAGIQRLLDLGAERVAYVDIDVHHGDGVERIFWNDPRVLTISVHESGHALFPGTGWPGDIGGPDARGSAVNLALPPGTADSAWLRAIDSVVPQVLGAFDPQVMVTQHGCDSHRLDPLAHFAVSMDAQRLAHERLHDYADRFTGGKWVALGGGGYDLIDVVPRSWTHLSAIAAHAPIPASAQVPQQWRDYVRAALDRDTPAQMGDLAASELPVWVRPWEMGHNPDDAVDAAIVATRQAVFALHGLDPWFE